MTSGMPQRIVQLTDCHLFSGPHGDESGIDTWPRLHAVLQDLRRRTPDFDLLVVTGDTAHDEALATYEAVREALGEWVPRLRIVPGNHDDRALLRRVFPESCGDAGERLTFHAGSAGWQLIGLDSQLTGETPGELGDEQLAWLRSRLEAVPDVSTLLFVHHPPIEVGSPWLDEIGLQDADALGRILHGFPQVRLVACGHVHQEGSGSLSGASVHTTPAVGPQFRPHTGVFEIEPGPPGYRVIELYPDGRWSTGVVRCAAE
jgi:Icc protein